MIFKNAYTFRERKMCTNPYNAQLEGVYCLLKMPRIHPKDIVELNLTLKVPCIPKEYIEL